MRLGASLFLRAKKETTMRKREKDTEMKKEKEIQAKEFKNRGQRVERKTESRRDMLAFTNAGSGRGVGGEGYALLMHEQIRCLRLRQAVENEVLSAFLSPSVFLLRRAKTLSALSASPCADFLSSLVTLTSPLLFVTYCRSFVEPSLQLHCPFSLFLFLSLPPSLSFYFYSTFYASSSLSLTVFAKEILTIIFFYVFPMLHFLHH